MKKKNQLNSFRLSSPGQNSEQHEEDGVHSDLQASAIEMNNIDFLGFQQIDEENSINNQESSSDYSSSADYGDDLDEKNQ